MNFFNVKNTFKSFNAILNRPLVYLFVVKASFVGVTPAKNDWQINVEWAEPNNHMERGGQNPPDPTNPIRPAPNRTNPSGFCVYFLFSRVQVEIPQICSGRFGYRVY
jgi:hypothetical protein